MHNTVVSCIVYICIAADMGVPELKHTRFTFGEHMQTFFVLCTCVHVKAVKLFLTRYPHRHIRTQGHMRRQKSLLPVQI